MSDFENAMSEKVDLCSTMMVHEGGTKFYEVILLKPTTRSPTLDALCLTRWGSVNSKNQNGTFGRGKILHRNFEQYTSAIIRNKMGRGYRAEGDENIYEGHNALRIATAYRMIERIGEDAVVADYFRSLGVDIGDAIKKLVDTGEFTAEVVVDKPKKPIVRSPLFGSW